MRQGMPKTPKKASQTNLKELQKHWYRKLKDSGFNDIEAVNNPLTSEPLLKEWDSSWFHLRNSPVLFKLKQDYFYLGEHFLEANRECLTPLEVQIWTHHLNGLGVRQIALKIKASSHLNHHDLCQAHICSLFCSVPYAPIFRSLNKDKIAAMVIKLKEKMRIFMRENIEVINREIDEFGFVAPLGGLVWIN